MVVNYGIFFSYNDKVIRLPINPEELPETLESNNSTYNVLGIGDITVPRLPKQREVQIASFFPGSVNSMVLTPNSFMTPEEYIDFFRKAMYEKRILTYTPVRYLEDGTPFATSDTGFKCTVESFDVSEKGGETGDFYYNLIIREYKDYTPQTVQIIPPKAEEPPVATETPDRETPSGKIVVGSICIANGKYYNSSYQDEPHGTANGRRVVVVRIVNESRKCPYLIHTESGGGMGWIAKSGLTLVK